MKKVVMIDGGIGRVMCAVPAIEKLAKSHEVVVVTHWIDVFLNNTSVSRLYHPTFPYLFDDVVKGNELVNPEPYHMPAYYDHGCHLIEAFEAAMLGGRILEDDERLPKLYLSKEEANGGRSTIEQLRKEHKRPVICIQPFSAAYSKETCADPTLRSMSEPLLQMIVQQIDATFLNFGLHPINDPKVINFNEELGLRKHFSMVAHADYCIGIDSVMTHVAAAFGRVGTFFYGSTSPKQLGYERFQNIARAGYPKGHQSFRIPTNPMLNSGAMDWTEQEIDSCIHAIMEHMKKCGLFSEGGKSETPSHDQNEMAPERHG